jgi:hypothetical protein
VHQVGHLPELYKDTRSEKYKKTKQEILDFWFVRAFPTVVHVKKEISQPQSSQ